MVTFILFFLLGYFLTKKTGSSGCCLGGCLLTLVGLGLIFFPLLLYAMTDEIWILALGVLIWLLIYWRNIPYILLGAVLCGCIGYVFGGVLLGALIGGCLALMFSLKDE